VSNVQTAIRGSGAKTRTVQNNITAGNSHRFRSSAAELNVLLQGEGEQIHSGKKQKKKASRGKNCRIRNYGHRPGLKMTAKTAPPGQRGGTTGHSQIKAPPNGAEETRGDEPPKKKDRGRDRRGGARPGTLRRAPGVRGGEKRRRKKPGPTLRTEKAFRFWVKKKG